DEPGQARVGVLEDERVDPGVAGLRDGDEPLEHVDTLDLLVRSAPGSEQRAGVVLGVLREIRAARMVVHLPGTVAGARAEIGMPPLNAAVEGRGADKYGDDAEAV